MTFLEHQCGVFCQCLNHGELFSRCSLIGIKYSGFQSQCISNAKRLLSETFSLKHYGQVCFHIKWYQDSFLVQLISTPPDITTPNHACEQISYLYPRLMNGSATKLRLQYTVRLYNPAQDNVSPLNPLHYSEGYASDKLL